MGFLICLVIILGVVGYCMWTKKSCQKEYDKEFQILESQFYENLGRQLGDGNTTYINLINALQKIMEEIHKIKETKLSPNYYSLFLKTIVENYNSIDKLENLIHQVSELKDRVNFSEDCYMMVKNEYGKVNRNYYNQVNAMQRNTVDTIVRNWKAAYGNNNYEVILNIQPEVLSSCVWFYAMEKPFSASAFNEIGRIYNLVHKDHLTNELFIAELFSIKQMGGTGVVRTKVQNYIKQNNYGERSLLQKFAASNNSVTEDVALTNVASALMWMNAYDAENIILEHMLERQLQMPAKLQERLHSLSNGGGKAPDGYDVKSDMQTLYFDVSAISWKDDEYRGLFENLGFQEKILTYSLAIRDEDKELFTAQGFKLPGIQNVLKKIETVFSDEYGNNVSANVISSIALSGNGREELEGIFVQSKECSQLGIFVHIASIGKKLNIKFYTLFMPASTDFEIQKQQVISMQKKMSPNVTMWENSLKDTILLAIQQILNDVPTGSKIKDEDNGDRPSFEF